MKSSGILDASSQRWLTGRATKRRCRRRVLDSPSPSPHPPHISPCLRLGVGTTLSAENSSLGEILKHHPANGNKFRDTFTSSKSGEREVHLSRILHEATLQRIARTFLVVWRAFCSACTVPAPLLSSMVFIRTTVGCSEKERRGRESLCWEWDNAFFWGHSTLGPGKKKKKSVEEDLQRVLSKFCTSAECLS